MRTFRALFVLLALGAACKGSRDVGLSISLPRDLVETTAWFEVGAYKDASCAAITPMLTDGVPEGFTTRVAFRKDDKELYQAFNEQLKKFVGSPEHIALVEPFGFGKDYLPNKTMEQLCKGE